MYIEVCEGGGAGVGRGVSGCMRVLAQTEFLRADPLSRLFFFPLPVQHHRKVLLKKGISFCGFRGKQEEKEVKEKTT